MLQFLTNFYLQSENTMAFYFDPTNVDVSNTIPEGIYKAMITDIADQETKKGGALLNIELTIIDNEKYSHRKIFDRLNYNCPTSQVSQDIAQRSLTNIILAKFGEKKVTENESELLPAVLEIVVTVEHDDYKNDKVNRVKAYKVPAVKEDVAF